MSLATRYGVGGVVVYDMNLVLVGGIHCADEDEEEDDEEEILS